MGVYSSAYFIFGCPFLGFNFFKGCFFIQRTGPSGGLQKCFAFVGDDFGPVLIAAIDQQQIQFFFMIGPATGAGAKTGTARRLACLAHQGGGFIGFEPIRVFVIRCIKIESDQRKGLGITWPYTDNRLRGVVLIDFL